VVGYGVLDHTRAEVATTRGAISVGEGHGALGVTKPHIIERPTRVRHISVFGATGSGKSTVIKNLVAQDFAAPGRPGVMVVDIKDDLVLDIARRVPAERVSDVLLFDPTDTTFRPIGTKVELYAGTLYQKWEVAGASGYLGRAPRRFSPALARSATPKSFVCCGRRACHRTK